MVLARGGAYNYKEVCGLFSCTLTGGDGVKWLGFLMGIDFCIEVDVGA